MAAIGQVESTEKLAEFCPFPVEEDWLAPVKNELKRYFHRILKIADGLHAIIITDREGVPVLKIGNEHAPELAMRPKFLGTAGLAMDQAGKLGLSSNKYIISMYGNYQVVSFNKLPLIVTMIAHQDANTGMLLQLDEDINKVLPEIRAAVDTGIC